MCACSSQQWTEHIKDGAVSVDLFSCESSGVGIDAIMAAHAVLMTVAFGLLIPLGVMTTRFQRPRVQLTVANDDVTGQPMWFSRHKAYQSTGITLGFVGFLLGIATKSNRTTVNSDLSLHAKLGIAVVFFACFLQPALVLLRALVARLCFSKDTRAPEDTAMVDIAREPGRVAMLWTFFHRIFGYVALILVIPALYFGLVGSSLPGRRIIAAVFAVAMGFMCTMMLVCIREENLTKEARALKRSRTNASIQSVSPTKVHYVWPSTFDVEPGVRSKTKVAEVSEGAKGDDAGHQSSRPLLLTPSPAVTASHTRHDNVSTVSGPAAPGGREASAQHPPHAARHGDTNVSVLIDESTDSSHDSSAVSTLTPDHAVPHTVRNAHPIQLPPTVAYRPWQPLQPLQPRAPMGHEAVGTRHATPVQWSAL